MLLKHSDTPDMYAIILRVLAQPLLRDPFLSVIFEAAVGL